MDRHYICKSKWIDIIYAKANGYTIIGTCKSKWMYIVYTSNSLLGRYPSNDMKIRKEETSDIILL